MSSLFQNTQNRNYINCSPLSKGSRTEIWTLKTCNDEESPHFVIFAFSTDRHDSSTKGPTIFGNWNITNIRLTMKIEYRPGETYWLRLPKASLAGLFDLQNALFIRYQFVTSRSENSHQN